MTYESIPINKRCKDITGQKFGRMTAIYPVGKSKNNTTIWLCVCECGTKTRVRLDALTSGETESCGCLWFERNSKDKTIHGMSGAPEYGVWASMSSRCNNPNDISFGSYGGRGIRVDYKSFESFYADMGDRPSSKHSIDRINNDGNYTIGNCRWATPGEQLRNSRQTHNVTHKGKTMCVVDWARHLGMSRAVLSWRLNSGKWSTEDALMKPVRKKRKAHE